MEELICIILELTSAVKMKRIELFIDSALARMVAKLPNKATLGLNIILVKRINLIRIVLWHTIISLLILTRSLVLKFFCIFLIFFYKIFEFAFFFQFFLKGFFLKRIAGAEIRGN